MALPIAIMAGTSLASGLLGARGARRAARRQAQAIQAAIDTTQQSYNEAGNLLAPRAEQEQAAMARVNALLGLGGEAPDYSLFRETPGYEFQQEEARRQVERTAAARGGLLSGGTLAAVLERSQGIADTTFRNYLADLMGLQSQGVDAAQAQLAVDRGSTIGNLLVGQGAARASGVAGATNALTGAINRFGGFASEYYGK